LVQLATATSAKVHGKLTNGTLFALHCLKTEIVQSLESFPIPSCRVLLACFQPALALVQLAAATFPDQEREENFYRSGKFSSLSAKKKLN